MKAPAEQNPKAEARRPKEGRKPKSEAKELNLIFGAIWRK
jgi:hypothetical protein